MAEAGRSREDLVSAGVAAGLRACRFALPLVKQSWNQAAFGLTLAAMRTFNASLSSVSLWGAVLVPPILFFLLVQVLDNAMYRGELGIGGLMLLIALAQLLPLGALAWILFSSAAYTIAPGKLIIHRVVSDREFPWESTEKPPRLHKGVIILSVPPQGKISLRVDEPQACLNELQNGSVIAG